MQPYWDELDERDPELELMREGCSLPSFLTARVRDGCAERAAELMTAPAAFAQRSAMDAAAGAADGDVLRRGAAFLCHLGRHHHGLGARRLERWQVDRLVLRGDAGAARHLEIELRHGGQATALIR